MARKRSTSAPAHKTTARRTHKAQKVKETPEQRKGRALIELKKLRPWRYDGHKGGFNRWTRLKLRAGQDGA